MCVIKVKTSQSIGIKYYAININTGTQLKMLTPMTSMAITSGLMQLYFQLQMTQQSIGLLTETLVQHPYRNLPLSQKIYSKIQALCQKDIMHFNNRRWLLRHHHWLNTASGPHRTEMKNWGNATDNSANDAVPRKLTLS